MNFERTAKLKKGLFFGLAFIAFAFVVFVLFRNDFAVDMNDLPGAVKKALGIRTVAEQQAALLAQLDVTPAEVFKQKLKDGKVVTVVTGEIQNTSRYPMEHVMVEGRLYDGTRRVRVTTAPVPCGKTAGKTALAGMTSKSVWSFYLDGAAPFNCTINNGFRVPFMVVFETLPPEFNATFKFEVHPHSGKFSDE